MRKSTFNTPRGSNHSGWDSNERGEKRGYSFKNSQNNSMNEGDFIPFNLTSQSPGGFSTPRGTNYYRGRGRGGTPFGNSPGYHNRSDNFSPRGKFTPYKFQGKSQRGWNRGSHRGGLSLERNREIPIANYFHLPSCLEDPWKNLMEKNYSDLICCQENDRKSLIVNDKNSSVLNEEFVELGEEKINSIDPSQD